MAKKKTQPPVKFELGFLCPKNWGILFLNFLLWLIGLLPIKTRLSLGKWIGRRLYKLATKRRKLVFANLKLAMPTLTEETRQKIALEHFESFGCAVAELTIAGHGPHPKKISANEYDFVTFYNPENLLAAVEKGKGVLALTPHFTHLDISATLIQNIVDTVAVYRPNDNPYLDYTVTSRRAAGLKKSIADSHISSHDTRGIIRALRQGKVLAYLSDQKHTGKGSLNVPFFGVDAPSYTATSDLARITGCAVVPLFTRRIGTKYEMYFLPALDNFPSGDDYADTLRLHQLYEAEIQQNPAQYLWLHNRWNLEWNGEDFVIEQK